MAENSKSSASTRRWERIKAQAREIKQSFRDRFEVRRFDHDIAEDESDLIDVKAEIIYEYEGVYSKQVTDLAARSLQNHEWVMKGHPRRNHIARPIQHQVSRLGHARELRARARLAGQITRLRAAIGDYRAALGPVGGNDARDVLELDEDIPPSAHVLECAIEEFERQLSSGDPTRIKVQHARRRLRAWSGTWKWFREKADRAANSVVDQIGPIAKWLIISTLLLQSGDKLAEQAQHVHEDAEHWELCVFDEGSLTGTDFEPVEPESQDGLIETGIPPPRRANN